MREWIAAVLAVAVLGCSDRLSGGESESNGAASDTETETGPSEPDLPLEECSAQVLSDCSSDSLGFTCSATPAPDIAIPMCSELSWGPRALQLSSGLAACGCEWIQDLRLHDFNGDGADELLASCLQPEAVLVWSGRADGLLSCATVYPSTAPGKLWLIDFDEDGLEDLLTVAWDITLLEMSLLHATAPGLFDAPQPLELPQTMPLGVTLELDIDGDARSELLSSYLSFDTAIFEPVQAWTAEAGQITLDLEPFGQLAGGYLHRADVDGNGWPDLVVAAEQSWWVRGSATGLGTPEPFDDGAQHFQIAVGDVDGDTLADLVLGGQPPSYRLGSGDGSFGAPLLGHDSPFPDQLAGEAELVHDLDADGRGEIIISASALDDGWSVWRSSYLGPRFDMQVDLLRTVRYAAGDVDGDGRGDLVTASVVSAVTNSQLTRWRAGG